MNAQPLLTPALSPHAGDEQVAPNRDGGPMAAAMAGAGKLSPRPMQVLFVEFDELYARHLCRHSQFGVNVAHLIALFATWYAVYGLIFWVTEIEWTLAVPALAYLAALAPNIPVRILAATALFLALVIAAVLMLPQP